MIPEGSRANPRTGIPSREREREGGIRPIMATEAGVETGLDGKLKPLERFSDVRKSTKCLFENTCL